MRVKSGYCPSSEEHVYPPRIMSLSDSDLEGEDGQLQSEYHPMTGVQCHAPPLIIHALLSEWLTKIVSQVLVLVIIVSSPL